MPKPIDADDIADQSAVLMRHLQSAGIAFVPQPDSDEVENWVNRMTVVRPDGDSSTEPAVAKPVAASPTETNRVAESPAPISKPAPAPASPAPVVLDEATEHYSGVALPQADRILQLQTLEQQAAQCTQCNVLSQCRSKTVFGEGSPSARIVFFGEGPGADEDRTGRPFVGKAGQLLTKMIEACKLQREDCYILNTVKCRPPGNRNPEHEEIANCRPFFESQLQILRPEYIVCLGAVASQSLLKSKLSVGMLRGKLHRYFDSKVLVTYHPAYLLRNPSVKKAAWQDLQIMLRDAKLI